VDSSRNRSNVEPNSGPIATFSEEGHRHSFIVRIWLEETFEETGKARWRGHITHVPSGERRYLKDLSDIGIFILPYLDSMKIHSGFRWRLWKWLFGLDSDL
jgi:hypothetical protein